MKFLYDILFEILIFRINVFVQSLFNSCKYFLLIFQLSMKQSLPSYNVKLLKYLYNLIIPYF